MNTMLFIAEESGLIYVRILKSASTSVLKSFIPKIDINLTNISLTDEQLDAIAHRYVKQKIHKHQINYTFFTVIRNPFHRIVSVYLDLFNPSNEYFSYSTFCFGVLDSDMNFTEFIKTISNIPEFLRGPHFSSQYYIISRSTSIQKITWFRIEKDTIQLTKYLTDHQIALMNQNKNTPYDYRSFYNRETLRLVYSMYEKDVLFFGYSEEYESLKQSITIV